MNREEMSKQDYVQKYLEDILADAWRRGTKKQGIDVSEEADKVRLHLTKWGVVVKVDIPIEGIQTIDGWMNKARIEAIRSVAVEPLIKEVQLSSSTKNI